MKIITNSAFPIGSIHYICMYLGTSPVTCYVIRGRNGDMLVDSGFYTTYPHLLKWLEGYDIRHIFLTHAHVDHDFNAARLREKTGAKILLGSHDLPIIGHYSRQPVKAALPKYRLRNVQQNLCGGMKLFSTKPYRPDIVISPENRNILRDMGYAADIVPLSGHTLGSTGILSDGVLYCGDAFTAMWGKPDITPHATSLRLMCRSIEGMLKISPKWLATGHGLPVAMRAAEPVIRGYLAEREKI